LTLDPNLDLILYQNLDLTLDLNFYMTLDLMCGGREDRCRGLQRWSVAGREREGYCRRMGK